MADIKAHTLSNNNGMRVELIDWGARVRSILFPVNGKLTEMTLTYPAIEDYRQDPFYLGASIGRVANRIAQASFELEGKVYELAKNNNGNCLHGGQQGFSAQSWQFNQETLSENQAELSLFSPDGDQGFPGNLEAKVRYHLTHDNKLMIDYSAICDKDTPINLCNHCYFHLGQATIEELFLQINGDKYLPIDKNGIPTGQKIAIQNSDFSFISRASVGRRINFTTNKQITENKGYDHCYLLSAPQIDTCSAKLINQTTGVTLSIYTDQPGLQFYSGQYLEGKFAPYQAICLEAQNFPDDINQNLASSTITPADTYYRKQLIYQFMS